MHIAQQIIWRKKLEEYDENPIFIYFEKQHDPNIPSKWVILFTNDKVRMQLAHATTRDAVHI